MTQRTEVQEPRAFTSEVAELAAKTAAEIRRRGWVQGAYRRYRRHDNDKTCMVCPMAAAGIAAGLAGYDSFYEDFDEAGREFLVALADEVVPDWVDRPGEWRPDDAVIDWNDAYGRTQGEVLAVLDKIANAA